MSFLVAVPAGILLALIGFQSRELHGENLFSGVMAVFVIMAGVLALLLVAGPFVLMGLYPKEGFAGVAPEAPAEPAPSPATSDDDEDELDDDMEEEPSAFDDDGDFEEDGGDEEFFDEGMDDGDFDSDDDDDEWG